MADRATVGDEMRRFGEFHGSLYRVKTAKYRIRPHGASDFASQGRMLDREPMTSMPAQL